METVQQNGRFTVFSSKFPSNIYSILYVYMYVLILGPDLSVRKFINLRLKSIHFTQIQRKKTSGERMIFQEINTPGT